MRKSLLIPFVLASLLLSTMAMADVPPLIPIQGVATDSEDVPLDGAFQVAFSIYADANGEERLWEETQAVTFFDGSFTAYLGSNVTLNMWFFRDYSEVYLGVAIGGDEEMDLITIGSAPYAAYAGYAGTAQDSDKLAGQGPEAFTYQAGDGVNLQDNVFSVNDAAIVEIAKGAAFDTEDEITQITNELYLPVSYLPDWANLQNIPAYLLDGDDDTTYQAGSGLSLSETGSFALDEQGCQAGFVLKRNEANDGWSCLEDDGGETVYTGADFATSGQICEAGDIVSGISALGSLICSPDQNDNSTYSGANFALSAQSCVLGQMVTGVNADGQLTCAEDLDTQNTYSGTDFAMSAQSCELGQVVTGINADGQLTCAEDLDTQNTYSGTDFAMSDQGCTEGEVIKRINADGTLECTTLPSARAILSKPVLGQTYTGYTNEQSQQEIASMIPLHPDNRLTPTRIKVYGYTSLSGSSYYKGDLTLRFHYGDGTTSDYGFPQFGYATNYQLLETIDISTLVDFHHDVTKITLLGRRVWSANYTVYGKMVIDGHETEAKEENASKPILGQTHAGYTNSQTEEEIAAMVPLLASNRLTPTRIKVYGYASLSGSAYYKGNLKLRFHYGDGTTSDYALPDFSYASSYQLLETIEFEIPDGFQHDIIQISLRGRRTWSVNYTVYGKMEITGYETVQ